MQRLIVRLFIGFVVTLALTAGVHAAMPKAKEPQLAAMTRIELYLSSLTTVQAHFTQVAPNGELSEGTFYLQRPGKMRWDYQAPNPVLIIADGSQLVYYDRELGQVTHVPIDDTLIGFLGQPRVRLTGGQVKLVKLEQRPAAMSVAVVQKDKPKDGQLIIEFSDQPLQLRNLEMTDAAGNVTKIALSDAKFGDALDEDLFAFIDPRETRGARRRR